MTIRRTDNGAVLAVGVDISAGDAAKLVMRGQATKLAANDRAGMLPKAEPVNLTPPAADAD